jgi:hypothetical protein
MWYSSPNTSKKCCPCSCSKLQTQEEWETVCAVVPAPKEAQILVAAHTAGKVQEVAESVEPADLVPVEPGDLVLVVPVELAEADQVALALEAEQADRVRVELAEPVQAPVVHTAVTGLVVPEGSVPEGSVPEGSVPEGSVQEGSAQEGSVPEGSVPEGSVPEGSVQEGSAQEGSVPEGSVPERSVPEGSVPEGSVQALVGPVGARAQSLVVVLAVQEEWASAVAIKALAMVLKRYTPRAA